MFDQSVSPYVLVGVKELITPPLDGTILPGITRASILELTREWDEFKVLERPVTMQEVIHMLTENRLLEMFGSGTAAIVASVQSIKYLDKVVSFLCLSRCE